MNQLATHLALFISYVASGYTGLLLANSQASLLWPPSGLGIAAIAVLGWRGSVTMFYAAWLTNWLLYNNAAGSAVIAMGNACEYLIAGLLIRVYGLTEPSESPQRVLSNVTGYVTSVQLGAFVAATVGTVSATYDGDSFAFWARWFVGDLTGACLFGPPTIAALKRLREE